MGPATSLKPTTNPTSLNTTTNPTSLNTTVNPTSSLSVNQFIQPKSYKFQKKRNKINLNDSHNKNQTTKTVKTNKKSQISLKKDNFLLNYQNKNHKHRLSENINIKYIQFKKANPNPSFPIKNIRMRSLFFKNNLMKNNLNS